LELGLVKRTSQDSLERDKFTRGKRTRRPSGGGKRIRTGDSLQSASASDLDEATDTTNNDTESPGAQAPTTRRGRRNNRHILGRAASVTATATTALRSRSTSPRSSPAPQVTLRKRKASVSPPTPLPPPRHLSQRGRRKRARHVATAAEVAVVTHDENDNEGDHDGSSSDGGNSNDAVDDADFDGEYRGKAPRVAAPYRGRRPGPHAVAAAADTTTAIGAPSSPHRGGAARGRGRPRGRPPMGRGRAAAAVGRGGGRAARPAAAKIEDNHDSVGPE
ncbi:hypothetical protein HK405_015452, partial [Cladochytrium tenue]